MKDFERMVDFCKVKDLSHEEENTKKDQEEIFVKKEAKSEE